MENITYYIVIAIILLAMETLYLPIARKVGIGDPVTPRSSHKVYTLTGGGFIFFIGAIICTLWFHEVTSTTMPKLLICGGALFLLSFIDDYREISPGFRLTIHAAIVTYTFYPVILNGHLDIFLILLLCSVGFINGFNFMDGINGMMALYSIVTLTTLYYMYDTSVHIGYFTSLQPLIITFIIAALVLCIFNYRKNALVFPGDVGSIVLGYFIAYFIAHYIITTAEASVIIILIIYAIDSALTIIQRLFMGEDIFTPHRRHLYQRMVDVWHIEHRLVSLYYAAAQAVINVGYFITSPEYRWSYTIIVTMIVATAYFLMKRSIPNNA